VILQPLSLKCWYYRGAPFYLAEDQRFERPGSDVVNGKE
jgi:hypothetical protein